MHIFIQHSMWLTEVVGVLTKGIAAVDKTELLDEISEFAEEGHRILRGWAPCSAGSKKSGLQDSQATSMNRGGSL